MKIALVKQADGTIAQWSNCTAAGYSMVVYAATNGAHPVVDLTTHVSPFCHTMRAYYGTYTGGIPWSVAGACVQHYFGLTIRFQYGLTWEQFRDFVITGHPSDVSIQYSAIHGTAFDACYTFTSGLHSVSVFERRWNSALNREEFLVGDPLADGRHSWVPKGPQWWPASLLKKAMLLSGGGTYVNAFIAPIPPTVVYTKKVACNGGAYRIGAGVPNTKKASTVAGQVVTLAQSTPVTGGNWSGNCGGAKTGNKWYKIKAINGKSVLSLYGVTYVYAATLWFS